MSATAYFTGVCPICDEEGRGWSDSDPTVGAGKCSVCGEFWPLDPWREIDD